MADEAWRFRGLSWQQDRVGAYRPGGCAELLREQWRLGYLRVCLRAAGYVSPECLGSMLARSPGRILPDRLTRAG